MAKESAQAMDSEKEVEPVAIWSNQAVFRAAIAIEVPDIATVAVVNVVDNKVSQMKQFRCRIFEFFACLGLSRLSHLLAPLQFSARLLGRRLHYRIVTASHARISATLTQLTSGSPVHSANHGKLSGLH